MVSLTQKAKQSGGGSLSTLMRKSKELQLVNESTIAYITGSSPDDIISLQEIKDTLKAEKGNPFKMHAQPGHANAHIRTDMLYLVTKGLRDKEGKAHRLRAKELGSRVIFINAQLARELIAKAPSKQKDAMQARFEKVMSLPDRASYGTGE